MASSDPFMSQLATQLGYSTGELRALQLIVLAAFGVEDYVGPLFGNRLLNNSWAVGLT